MDATAPALHIFDISVYAAAICPKRPFPLDHTFDEDTNLVVDTTWPIQFQDARKGSEWHHHLIIAACCVLDDFKTQALTGLHEN